MIRGPDTPGNSVAHSAGHDGGRESLTRTAIIRADCRWIEERAAGGTSREDGAVGVVGRHGPEIESWQVQEPVQCDASRLASCDGSVEASTSGAKLHGLSGIPEHFVGLVDLAVGAILGEDCHSKARSVPAAGKFDG